MRLGVFEVDDSLRGQPLMVTAGQGGTYTLTHIPQDEPPRELGQGRVGELARFANGDIELRLAELQAAEGAEFILTKHTRPAAIKRLAGRLSVAEVGGGRNAGTGMLRLTLTGPDREEIRRSLDAVAETFLTQNVQRQSAEAEQSLAFLEEQAPQLRDQLAAAEDNLNEYRVEQDSVDLSAEAQATIQQFIELESQINELEFQEAELAQRYTPSHPTYQSLLRQKRQLEERRAELNERVDALPAAQQEVIRRTRDVEVTQAIYVNVLNKMQEMEVARAGTVGNVRIIDEALVAGMPITPRKPLAVVVATLLGGMLAVGIVLVRSLFNRGVEAPEQLEDAGLPVYATVPLSDEQKKLVKRIKHRRDRHASEVVSGVLADRAPADTSVEALRGLRTSLHFAMLEASDNRLMITGPSPGIGKSFIAINLAGVCALAGQKVLVVDADMRKGHLHHAFKVSSNDGLSELLGGQLPLDEVIRASGIDGLDYVTRGTAPPNPSELLMTAGFSRFLEEAGQRYDLVIIDTPPVLAVTDAAVVGAQCGTTLLVARFQVNPLREMQIATRRLESAGVTVKGAILNAMERKAAASYGYGYYQYSYS
ncbi:polysaccharide biosynthesis tyrosine autokinase [Halomonas sp. ATCH28]|uniref:Polysaccharide biosynthesis tyrosine autokinase n=1 Tax=Halomonas gemina TaxID=2945105 RepID=A0ABT0SZB9_9GAMM|nr:polysaccharide biosynthesis tyrosine autokinase [Halomonas gemina]MCL7939470.1 polysaccharide biosynthesis tyrosine autokinase [Halomonas gemina]